MLQQCIQASPVALWYGRFVPAAAEGIQPLMLSGTEMVLVWRPCSFVCYFVSVSCTVAR